jgi:hypothetical protein
MRKSRRQPEHTKLRSPASQWEVHFQVEGLSISQSPVSVGNVEFYEATGRRWKHILSLVDDISRLSTNPRSEQDEIALIMKQRFDEYLSGKTIAKVQVSTDSQKNARSQSLRDLRLTLDVLNFYADIVEPADLGARVYLPGEAVFCVALSPAFKFVSSPGSGYLAGSYSFYKAGPMINLRLTKASMRSLRPHGFKRICEILGKHERDRTAIENRILSAFRWAGRATLNDQSSKKDQEITDSRREEAFLLYAVALESLLLKRETELTYKLGTRGAHVLESSPAKRSEIVKRLSHLYGLRSKIVHSGSTQISRQDLSEIRGFAKKAIINILMNKEFRMMRSEDEFHKWFENRMLR